MKITLILMFSFPSLYFPKYRITCMEKCQHTVPIVGTMVVLGVKIKDFPIFPSIAKSFFFQCSVMCSSTLGCAISGTDEGLTY